MNHKTPLIASVWLLSILLSCKADKDILPDWFSQGWGRASASANGEKWTNISSGALLVKGQFSKQPELTVQVFKFSHNGLLRGLVELSLIPQQVNGQYTLTNNITSCNNDCTLASYHTYKDDGDVSGSVYTLDSSQVNYIKVIAYDSVNKQIAGEFRATFVKGISYHNEDPIVVQLESGTFDTPISNKGRF